MKDRFQDLLALRPIVVNAKISESMSTEERFQNETLRPIIKFQNDLLLHAFRNYIVKRKNKFHALTLQERIDYIAHAVQKDLKFRNSIKGMIIGHYTIDEYERYILNSSALNKRMMNMVTTRIQDQVQFFDKAMPV